MQQLAGIASLSATQLHLRRPCKLPCVSKSAPRGVLKVQMLYTSLHCLYMHMPHHWPYSPAHPTASAGWTYEMKNKAFPVKDKGAVHIHLVPYSEHSSYSELREYVRWLRPAQVPPQALQVPEKGLTPSCDLIV